MSFAIASRIARRELRGGLKGFRVFLACLALGVAAIAAVGTVRESIRAGLDREGAVILGGDAALELTYRFAEAEERIWIDEVAMEVSEIVDFRSMAVFGAGEGAERGLTQVKGVDDAYPLYGAVSLEPEMALDNALSVQDGVPGAVMDPVLIARLGIVVGEQFQLGAQAFELRAALLREPDSATGGFALGPRTLVRTEALAESGLIQPGTLFETEYKLKLADGADLDVLAAGAEAAITGARWRDRRNGAPGISEFVDRLGSFLVLVGLAGLAVGGVGVSAAVRAYLDEKTEVIAALKTLGAEARVIFLTYFLQIGVLTVLSIALGVGLGAVVPLLFAPLIEAQLPVPAEFGLHLRPLGEAALYGALAALVFTIWPLARTEQVRAAALFRDSAGGGRELPRARWIGLTLMLLTALVMLAATFSGLVSLTVWAALGLGGAFVVLVLVAWGVRGIARRLAVTVLMRGRSALRLAMGSVGGPGGEASSVILSLGLGLTVLAAVGQIDANLRGAIARDLPDVAPSFFMLDIHAGQLDEFRKRLDVNGAVADVQTAPMLRGIITEINGRPAAEVGGDHWVLQGDRGVTYSAEKPDEAVVTHGEWWPHDYAGPPLVSFATEEALEMGLKLGALQGAPHTHIATVYADEDEEGAILREISNAYPNVTAIRVRDAIDRVSGVLAGIAAAITYGALATLVTGGIVLIGAAAAGVRARTYEAAVLKTLGATRATILASFALRSAILGAAAGLVAIVAGGLGRDALCDGRGVCL